MSPLSGKRIVARASAPHPLDLDHDALAESGVHHRVARSQAEALGSAGGAGCLHGGGGCPTPGPLPATDHDPLSDVFDQLLGDLLQEPAREALLDAARTAGGSRCA